MSETEVRSITGSKDILKILMLTGAIIGAVSIWQVWLSVGEGTMFQYIYSGYDLFTKRFGYPDTGYFIYMPLVVLLAAVPSIASSLLTFTKHERKSAVIGTFLGVVMLAASLLYIFYPESYIWLANDVSVWTTDLRIRDHLEGGAYSALIGSMFLIIGGVSVSLKKDNDPLPISDDEFQV